MDEETLITIGLVDAIKDNHGNPAIVLPYELLQSFSAPINLGQIFAVFVYDGYFVISPAVSDVPTQ